MVDNDDGTYGAELVIDQPGAWTAAVLLDGVPAEGAELSMMVQPRGVQAANCRIKRYRRPASVPFFQFRKETFLLAAIDDNDRFTGDETVLLQARAAPVLIGVLR